MRRDDLADRDVHDDVSKVAQAGEHQRRIVRRAVVAVDDELPEIEWTAADEWWLLLTASGTPFAELRLPNPGPGATPALLRAAILDQGAPFLVRRAALASLRRRMGTPPDPAPADGLRCSVAICTHRRPDMLERALASVRRAHPQPHEVLVVDSAPGDRPAEREAAAADARYVRVGRPGLNLARRAALEEAAGDVVVFLDDDCIVPTGWLARLPVLFADPSVAAVTAPAVAWRLDTPARVRRERVAPLAHGFEPRRWDWPGLRPVGAGRVGAGANLAVRRSALRREPMVLPTELDVGTLTRSGGDLYLLFRLLAGGWRVVYDPAGYVFHDHQPTAAALHNTVVAYGTGFSAFLARAMIADRELAAVTLWPWQWRQYARALRRRAAGAADPTEVRLFALYAAATLLGPVRWLRARRGAGATPPLRLPGEPERVAAGTGLQRLSILVDAPPGAAAGPAALAALRAAAPGAELLVADGTDAPAPTRDVVLVWDPGCVPAGGALGVHAAAHDHGAERVALGTWAPALSTGSLLSQWTALREADRSRRAGGPVPTVGDVGGGNVSVGRATFDRLAAAGRLRPGGVAVELAARALEAGIPFGQVPAPARRVEDPSHRDALRRAVAQGRADGALLARHAEAIGALECARAPTVAERALAGVVGGRAGGLVAAGLLELLVRVRARLLWCRLYEVSRRACHLHGLRASGAAALAAAARRSRAPSVALDGDDPVAPPPLAAPPVLDVRLRGRSVAEVAPHEGQWSGDLAAQVVDAVARRPLGRGRQWWRALPRPGPVAETAPAGPVVVIAASVTAVPPTAAARVELVGGDPARRWAEIDRALRRAAEPVAVVVLSGAGVRAASLGALETTVGAGRIAACLVSGAVEGEGPGPLTLGDRHTWRQPFPLLGRPPQCVVIRTGAYRALALDGLGARGETAAVVDLVGRALEQGWVVGHQELPGISPAADALRVRTLWEARRWHARGALLAREAEPLPPLRRVAFIACRGLAHLGHEGVYGPRALTARAVRAAALAAGAAGASRPQSSAGSRSISSIR